MSTELTYLTLTATLTALLLVPYLLNAMAVRGIRAVFLSGAPLESEVPLSPWARRLRAAHSNASENLGVFASLILVAHVLYPRAYSVRFDCDQHRSADVVVQKTTSKSGVNPMKQLSISLVLLFMLAISACANTPPPPGSLAAIHQQARKAIDTECVRALHLSVPGLGKVYYRISGGLVDVYGYCKAYAYSRTPSKTTIRNARPGAE